MQYTNQIQSLILYEMLLMSVLACQRDRLNYK